MTTSSGEAAEFRLCALGRWPLTSPLTTPADAMLLIIPPVFQFTTSGNISSHFPLFLKYAPISAPDGRSASPGLRTAEVAVEPDKLLLVPFAIIAERTLSGTPTCLRLTRMSGFRE